MAAQVTIHLVEKLCEHCPSQDDAWGWSFEIVGNQVVLVVRCKMCEAQLIYTEKQMHGRLSVNASVSSSAPQSHPDVPAETPQQDGQFNKPDRTVQHSHTFTPYDRQLLKDLKISTDDIEFEK